MADSWYAAVTYSNTEPITDAQLDALLEAAPGFSTASHNAEAGLLRLAFQVQAADRQAARARAASDGGEAVAAVLGQPREPLGVEIQPIPPLDDEED